MNFLTQMLIFPFHYHVMDILNEVNIKEAFPNPTRFNVNVEVGQRAMMRPESALLETNEHV